MENKFKKIKLEKAIKRMILASDAIQDDRFLVDFIYILGRDHLSLGKIEKIMLDIGWPKKTLSKYCNGWLAEYAQDVANRLTKTGKG